jgi:hypothetical protein
MWKILNNTDEILTLLKNQPTPTTPSPQDDTKIDEVLELLKNRPEGTIEPTENPKIDEILEILKGRPQGETDQQKETFIKDKLGYESEEKLKEVLGGKTLKEYLESIKTKPEQTEQPKQTEGSTEEAEDDDEEEQPQPKRATKAEVKRTQKLADNMLAKVPTFNNTNIKFGRRFFYSDKQE